MTQWEILREMSSGEIRTEITHVNKLTGQSITIVNDTQKTTPIAISHQETEARVKGGNGITLCMGFQSVRLDVGGDIPWPVRVGSVEGLKEGYDTLFDLVDDELVKRSEGLKMLLEQLVKEFGRR